MTLRKLYHSMRDLKKELFKVIYLNTQNQIIDTSDLFAGTVDSSSISPREVMENALKQNASSLIFVHNHPSGDPEPSRHDKEVTRGLVFAGNIMQIKVLDHIIIGGNKYFSFADQGLIEKYEDSFLSLKIRGLFEKQMDYCLAQAKFSASS
jgi:DNA repair protein RadC